ncbi:MAG: TonB-dependent receptor plug domain-containing protein [Chthoniobacterales bacterium]|nr:TonB-dependent receptor plug domain-containing protein [Chthoniobacterales bacterium]
MTKRALPLFLGFLCAYSPLLARQATAGDVDAIPLDQLRLTGEVDTAPALTLYRPDIFSTVDGALLIHSLPVLTLLDGRRFPISGDLGRTGMTPLDMIPVAFLRAVQVEKSSSPVYGTDAPGGIVNLQLNRSYSGGEAGLFYGSSGGKYGREDFQAYIRGGVGTDNVQISAGAAYDRSSGQYRSFSH